MKKLLSIFSVTATILGSSLTTISCNETRKIPSLDDSQYDIKGNDSAAGALKDYHNMNHWSSAAVSASEYKTEFVKNFNLTSKSETPMNYLKLLEYDWSNLDKTPSLDNAINNILPVQILDAYQKSSNSTGKKDFEATSTFKNFKFILMNGDKEIAETNPDASKAFNGKDSAGKSDEKGTWIKENFNNLNITTTNPGGVNTTVIKFNIEIIPTVSGIKAGYVGARKDLKTDTNIYQYFSQDGKLVVDTQDPKFSDGFNYDESKKSISVKKAYDYSFPVVFNIQTI